MKRKEMQEAHQHYCQVFFFSLGTLQDIPLSAHFSLAPDGVPLWIDDATEQKLSDGTPRPIIDWRAFSTKELNLA